MKELKVSLEQVALDFYSAIDKAPSKSVVNQIEDRDCKRLMLDEVAQWFHLDVENPEALVEEVLQEIYLKTDQHIAMDGLLTMLIFQKHVDEEGLTSDKIFIEDLVYDCRHQPFVGVHDDYRGLMTDAQAQQVIDTFFEKDWSITRMPNGGGFIQDFSERVQ